MTKSELIKSTHLSCVCDHEEEISDIMTIYANSQLVEFLNWYNDVNQIGQHISNSRIGQFNLNRDEKIQCSGGIQL